jgi:DNA polymerase-3 subunit delta
MTFEGIMAELRARKFKPVYFLMGEEPYFIDCITDYLSEHVLGESEKAFNQLILYGRDTDIGNIITTARRFPMMASHQVIIVKEAQHLRSLEGLESYLASPMQSALLAFAY